MALHIFGDDGTLRKIRMMSTITWFSALHSPLSVLHCRMPCFIIPMHSLEEVIVWSFEIWQTGRFPKLDPWGQPWPTGSKRWQLGEDNVEIAGGHVGVYTGTLGDQAWIKEHYRHEASWTGNEICFRCLASKLPGVHNFAQFAPCPRRATSDYLQSPGGRCSPLCRMPGYKLCLTREEPMHIGPLGVLPDAIGSCMRELIATDMFGFSDHVGEWKDRADLQLSWAYSEFTEWAQSSGEQHSIRRFARCTLGFSTLTTSWPTVLSRGVRTMHSC